MIKNSLIRRSLVILLAAMLPGLVMANLAVKITTVSGDSVVIPIEEAPKVSVIDGKVMVGQTSNVTLEFPLEDWPRFELGNFSGVDNLDGRQPTIKYENGQILLSGFRPDTRAAVHDLSGLLICSGTTDADGCLSLDMTASSAGIYIISTPSINTKLVIK